MTILHQTNRTLGTAALAAVTIFAISSQAEAGGCCSKKRTRTTCTTPVYNSGCGHSGSGAYGATGYGMGQGITGIAPTSYGYGAAYANNAAYSNGMVGTGYRAVGGVGRGVMGAGRGVMGAGRGVMGAGRGVMGGLGGTYDGAVGRAGYGYGGFSTYGVPGAGAYGTGAGYRPGYSGALNMVPPMQ